jgi:hypothetical protein
MRHFDSYKQERPIVLRIGFQSLLDKNQSADPLYCIYNSGSPRCSKGKKSPHGPDTFLSGERLDGNPSQVVEATFKSQILLPDDTEFGEHPAGPWRSLS